MCPLALGFVYNYRAKFHAQLFMLSVDSYCLFWVVVGCWWLNFLAAGTHACVNSNRWKRTRLEAIHLAFQMPLLPRFCLFKHVGLHMLGFHVWVSTSVFASVCVCIRMDLVVGCVAFGPEQGWPQGDCIAPNPTVYCVWCKYVCFS